MVAGVQNRPSSVEREKAIDDGLSPPRKPAVGLGGISEGTAFTPSSAAFGRMPSFAIT